MIEVHRASVTHQGQIVAEGLEVEVDFRREANGLKSWSGAFEVPRNAHISCAAGLQENYKIKLDDGREGEFLVVRETTGSHSRHVVEFQGTGPLERVVSN